MLCIAICDDEKEMRFALRYKLERILELRETEHEIYEFSSADGLLSWYEKNIGRLDLAFLDIEMQGTSGMQAGAKLREKSHIIQIAFVTSHKSYVFDGYGVGALGYLIKPPTENALDDILARALAALQYVKDDAFICQNGDGTYRIPKSSILYFASEKRQVECVTSTKSAKSLVFYAKLNDVADVLGKGFVRIHQRYLVNASKVVRIGQSEVELENATLPISRVCKKNATIALTKALLE